MVNDSCYSAGDKVALDDKLQFPLGYCVRKPTSYMFNDFLSNLAEDFLAGRKQSLRDKLREIPEQTAEKVMEQFSHVVSTE